MANLGHSAFSHEAAAKLEIIGCPHSFYKQLNNWCLKPVFIVTYTLFRSSYGHKCGDEVMSWVVWIQVLIIRLTITVNKFERFLLCCCLGIIWRLTSQAVPLERIMYIYFMVFRKGGPPHVELINFLRHHHKGTKIFAFNFPFVFFHSDCWYAFDCHCWDKHCLLIGSAFRTHWWQKR